MRHRHFAAVPLAVVLALVASSPGAAGAGPPVPGAGPSALPAGLGLDLVVAGDDEGWILGRSSSDGRPGVWRVRDGRASRTIELPAYRSLDAAAFGGGLAVAGVRPDGVAEVLFVSEDGTTRQGAHAERGSGGVDIVGTTASGVWVGTDRGLAEVGTGAKVLATAPRSAGMECVLGGRLTAVVDTSPRPAQTPGRPDVLPASPSSRTLELAAWTGSAWQPVAASARTFAGSSQVRCVGDGVDVTSGQPETLVARWVGGSGWTAAASPRRAPAGLLATDRAAGQTADGTVVRRAAAAYRTTGLRLPNLAVAGQVPPTLLVDESPGIVAGCVTARGRTACDAVPAGVGTLVAPGPEAAPSAGTAAVLARIHHYNICNAVPDTCNLSQRTAAQNVLVWFRFVDGGWFQSVNEICYEDYQRLAVRMEVGTRAWMVVSKRSESDCAGPRKEFGNALFFPGGVDEGQQAWYLRNPGKDCTALTTECRTMICVRLATFAGFMMMCTTHLSSASDQPFAVRFGQAEDYAWNAASFAAGRRVVVAGDFNLLPNELPGVYSGMRDLVLGSTHATRPGPPSRHIDYIFVENVGLRLPHAAYCPTDASDHCWTNGEWDPNL